MAPRLDRTYVLDDGQRVRVRLARSSDAAPIRELAARRRFDADPLEVARLTRFDPRRRLVICATALIGVRDTLVGVGAIGLAPGDDFEPETLIFDDRIAGLGPFLLEVLVSRAGAVETAA